MGEFGQQLPLEPIEILHDEPAVYSRRNILRVAALAVGASAVSIACGSTGDRPPVPQPQQTTFNQAPDDDPTLPPELDTSKEQDVLRGTWSFMPGVTASNDGLKVEHTGLAILTNSTDGHPSASPQYVDHPPVNMFGERVASKDYGNVGFLARLSQIKGPATVSFLSGPPIRRDESLQPMSGVSVTVNGGTATVKTYNGKDTEPSRQQDVDLGQVSSNADVVVVQNGDHLEISVNGKKVSLSAQPLQKETWFGLDASDSFAVSELKAYPIKGNELARIDGSTALSGLTQRADGLWGTAKAHGHGQKLIGSAVDMAELMANPGSASFIVENMNALVPENAAKMQDLQPEEGKFNFAELDAMVKFANDHNMTLHGHALVFTEAYPKWVSDTLTDPKTTKERAIEIMTNHVTTVMSRYNGSSSFGKIDSWDVVNEPFAPTDGEWGELNKESLWYKKIGPEYIDIAFQAAQGANPDATLFVNHWGGETDEDIKNSLTGMAKQLKKRGFKVGVGFQCHFDEETLAEANTIDDFLNGSLDDAISDLAKADIPARISEASVALNDDPEMQAKVYGKLMRVAMQHDNCLGINLWGITNSDYRNAYFTSGNQQDPGDDAPTTQAANGVVSGRAAWSALQQAAAA